MAIFRTREKDATGMETVDEKLARLCNEAMSQVISMYGVGHPVSTSVRGQIRALHLPHNQTSRHADEIVKAKRSRTGKPERQQQLKANIA